MTFSVTYKQIDTILIPWATERGLHVSTRYQEEEVRGIYIVDDSGDVYSLGVFPDQLSGGDIILSYGRAFPRGKKYRRGGSYTVTLETLKLNLNSVYGEIEAWIAERNHTRTPVL